MGVHGVDPGCCVFDKGRAGGGGSERCYEAVDEVEVEDGVPGTIWANGT